MRKPASKVKALVLFAMFIVTFAGSAFSADERSEPSAKMIRNTLKNIHLIATCAEAYWVDHNGYPSANNINDLVSFLQPTYSKKIVLTDAWGNELLVRSTKESFELISLGSDGRLDGYFTGGATESLSADIVVRNGEFVQCPTAYCDQCPADFCATDSRQRAQKTRPNHSRRTRARADAGTVR